MFYKGNQLRTNYDTLKIDLAMIELLLYPNDSLVTFTPTVNLLHLFKLYIWADHLQALVLESCRCHICNLKS